MRSSPYYERNQELARDDELRVSDLKGVPLRVVIYEDIKKYIKPAIIIAAILFALWYLWGWGEWYLYLAAIVGAISARIMTPAIAKRLMSYAAVVNFELRDTGHIDKLQIDLVPMPRFMNSVFIDQAGYPAALNAPLATRQGPAYIVEGSIYAGDEIPGTGVKSAVDIHEINPIHKNTEFLKKYKTAFLLLRKDALGWLHELNALKLTQKVEIAKGYTYRTRVFAELADKELYEIEEDPIQWEKLQAEIEELKERLEKQGVEDETVRANYE